jgi:hypothetical protein
MLRAGKSRTVDNGLKDFSGVKRHSPGNHQDQRFILYSFGYMHDHTMALSSFSAIPRISCQIALYS